MMLLDGKSSIT